MFTFPKQSGNKTFATGTFAALYGALAEWGGKVSIGEHSLSEIPEPSMGFVLLVGVSA